MTPENSNMPLQQMTLIHVVEDLKQHLYTATHSKRDIHCIRIAVKRLRAWTRLVGDNKSDPDWKALETGLRNNARHLSGKRDAQVILDTLTWLKKKTDSDNHGAIDITRKHLQFDSSRLQINWPSLKKAFAEQERMIIKLVERNVTDDLVMKGLKKSRKQIKKYGEAGFIRQGNPQKLHALRKWVKYLYYQLETINSNYINKYDSLSDVLNKLGDKLGRLHDLVVTREQLVYLSDTGPEQHQARITKELIDKQYKKLYLQSRKLYRKLLDQHPVQKTFRSV